MSQQTEATMHMHTVQWAVMRESSSPFPPLMLSGPYSTQAEAEAFCAAHRVSWEAHRQRLRNEGMNPDEMMLFKPAPYVMSRQVSQWATPREATR